jgi:hypothetical protein
MCGQLSVALINQNLDPEILKYSGKTRLCQNVLVQMWSIQEDDIRGLVLGL